jgi:hypothetical protein
VVVELPFPVIHGLGSSSDATPGGVRFWSQVANLGILFIENSTVDPSLLTRVKRLDHVFVGSAWLMPALEKQGVERARMGVFWQCVDYTLFGPADREPREPGGPFHVFSGEARPIDVSCDVK